MAQRGRRSKHGAAKARKASRKLKTIAARVVRQLDRSLPSESRDRGWLSVAKQVLTQKKNDAGKIYSLHEPHVYCLSKGKEHKKYEFGAKASVLVGKNGGVTLGAYSLPENDYDGHSLGEALAQVKRLCGYSPRVAIADRGYRGRTHWGETELITPKEPKKGDSPYQKRKARARFRRRSAIEPLSAISRVTSASAVTSSRANRATASTSCSLPQPPTYPSGCGRFFRLLSSSCPDYLSTPHYPSPELSKRLYKGRLF